MKVDNESGLIRRLAIIVLRVALVAALCASVWAIYGRLPQDDGPSLDDSMRAEATSLRIVLRGAAMTGRLPVQLYPINVTAARREFDSERRPGVRFDDFVMRRMGGRQPLACELDERGEAVVSVPPGRWWVHAAMLEGAEELAWRLPVNVAGREKTVELTPENAYTRAKSF